MVSLEFFIDIHVFRIILKSFQFPLLLLISIVFVRSTYAAFLFQGLLLLLLLLLLIIIIIF